MAPATIEILARGLLVSNGRVLLCRNVEHGYRYLPGGHVEPGECGATALAREFMEESGVAVGVGRLLLVSEHGFVQQGRPRHEINLTYAVTPPADRPDLLRPGGWASLEPDIAFDWVAFPDLAAADLRPASCAAWVAERVKTGNPGAAESGCGWFRDGLA
ncbi:MAG: NUDIX hydrolase [Phycisphaerales bacterium]